MRLPVIVLQHLPNVEAEACRLVAEEAERPFDLEHGPLLRVTLLKLAEESHIAVMVIHHIIADGWSMGVLFKEIAALYVAFSSNRTSPLEELPIQYADYAIWQRECLQGEVFEQELTYWREQLAGEI